MIGRSNAGGGANNLNFRVIGSSTEPANPKDNDIWVQTNATITEWQLRGESGLSWLEPEGNVIIQTDSTPSDPVFFNCLKKNRIYQTLKRCSQVIDGAWKTLNAYIYQEGHWIQFSKTFSATIAVTYPSGSTCTCSDGSTTLTATGTSGSYTFIVPNAGTWTVTSSNGSQSVSKSVSITASGDAKSVTLKYFSATIAVTYPPGSTCTCSDGSTTLTAANTSGSYTFTVLNTGTWTITCTDGSSTATTSVSITADGQSSTVSLAYVGLPTFAYTGSYQNIDDGNNNWRIKFLTSGTLTFSKLQGAGSGIDIFCVGGGGGGGASGGCGGRTTTVRAKTVTAGTSYIVTVGAGGAEGAPGGNSSFGSLASAAGGGGPGGAGGSGGGGSGLYLSSSNKANGGNGGSDGANGVNGYGTDGFRNGTGQGTTTREFGESYGTLYAGGGGGAGDYDCALGSGGAGGGGAGGSIWDNGPKAGGAGATNLGGGGGGGSTGGAGGSGIVIIRNKR